MRRAGLCVVALLLAALTVAPSAQQMRAEVALKAAVEQETVKGDLKGAIAAYQRIVDGYPENRPVRAQALVRMAECYQKLGDAQAKASFERVVKEFGDQPAAVQARAALARMSRTAAGATALETNRKIWTGTTSFYWFTGNASSDGRMIGYIDWEGGRYDLALLDLSSGESRIFIKGGNQPDGGWAAVTASAFSRDVTQIAYSWTVAGQGEKGHDQLRVSGLSVAAAADPEIVLSDPDLVSITPRDWSPDGRSIAVDAETTDRRRMVGIVPASGGPLKVLKRLSVRRTSGMQFSPDGRYLLFDLPGEKSNDRDIFAVDLSAGTEVSVVRAPGDDELLGFTPDGREILFSSTRSGVPGIWSAPFSPGSTGKATLLKADVRIDGALGLSSSGSFFYSPLGQTTSELRSGTLDVRTGWFTSPPTELRTELLGNHHSPRFSPDGQRLAFLTQQGGQKSFVIARPDGSQARTFPMPLRGFRNGNHRLWRWSADGKGFYAIGTNHQNQTGIHYIDAASGEVAWTIPHDEVSLGIGEESDGALRYWVDRGGSTRDFVFAEWNIAERRSTEIYRAAEVCRPGLGKTFVYCVQKDSIVRRDLATKVDAPVAAYQPGRAWQVSPDGRFLLTARQPAGGASSTWITDLSTGATRELPAAAGAFAFWWAPGSHAFMATKRPAPGAPPKVWWIPTDGGAAHAIPGMEQLDTDLAARSARLSGDRFVFQVTTPDTQWGLYVLENFLPRAPKESTR